MNNEKKYHFSDFTLTHYREIVNTLKPTHTFNLFGDFVGEKNVFLRHDVDFSLDNALSLAKVENELGVKSTYLIMLHSEYYSMMEKQSVDIIKDIIELGHSIGLHFDSTFYLHTSVDDFEKALLFEKSIIESLIGVKVTTFSFHNPSSCDLNYDKLSYGGMYNTYSAFYKSKLLYCSDSNGHWRFSRMMDLIIQNIDASFQLLTHPLWWTEHIDSPKSKIYKCVMKRSERNLLMYDEILNKHQRENIDW